MPKVASFSLDIDDKTFSKRAKKLLNDLGGEERDFVREQSRMLARDLAKFTPPFVTYPTGNKDTVGTAKDIAQGKEAVAIGLFSICNVRKKRKSINWAKKAFGSGPVIVNGVQIASGVIDDYSSLSKWHHRNRGLRGRTKRIPNPAKPIVHLTLLKKYIREKQKDVGVAKASFYRASLHFGGKHTAVKNIKMGLMKTFGKGTLKKTQKGYTGVISARTEGIFHTQRSIPMLQEDRKVKSLKRLKYIANALTKKSKLNDA